FMHRYVADDPGDVRRNRLLGGADIRIVDRNDPATGQPPIAGADNNHRDAAQHQDGTQQRQADPPARRRIADAHPRSGARDGLRHQTASRVSDSIPRLTWASWVSVDFIRSKASVMVSRVNSSIPPVTMRVISARWSSISCRT